MTAESPRILVVDDNEDNRFVLVQRLRREGFERVSVARDGQECLQKLKDPEAGPFALLLLDIMMPRMNGYEVLEEINRSEALKSIPVIMITAVGDMDSVYRCIGLGAKDYIVKPFNLDLVRTRIRTWVAPDRPLVQSPAPAAAPEAGPDEVVPDEVWGAATADRRKLGDRKGEAGTRKGSNGEGNNGNGPVGAIRRSEVGVLVGEICDLDAFADQAEPDDVAAVLARWRELCLQVCENWHVAAVGIGRGRLTATAGLFRTVGNPVTPLLGAAEDLASRFRSGAAAWSLRAGLHLGPLTGCRIASDPPHVECWGRTWHEAMGLLDKVAPSTLLISEAAVAHLGDQSGTVPQHDWSSVDLGDAARPLTVVTTATAAILTGEGAER